MRIHFPLVLFLLTIVGIGCKHSDSRQGGDRGNGGWSLIDVHCSVPVDPSSVRVCLQSDPKIGPVLSAFKNEVVEDSIVLPSGEDLRVWKFGRWAVDSGGKVYAMAILG